VNLGLERKSKKDSPLFREDETRKGDFESFRKSATDDMEKKPEKKKEKEDASSCPLRGGEKGTL